MNPLTTQNQPYAGLSPSIGAQSHTLYFTPLSELQKALRTDTSNVVVVTFIGKCSHSKTLLANLTIDQSAFVIREEDWVAEQLVMPQLEAYYDRQHATIYINLLSLFEDSMFLSVCQNLEKAIESAKTSQDFDVEMWLQLQELAEVKLLLHAFLLSHIVFLVQETAEMDVQWLDLLKNTAYLHSMLSSNADKVKFPSPSFKRLFEGPKPTLSLVCDITSTLTSRAFKLESETTAYVQETQKSLELQVKHLLRRPQFDCLFQLALPQHASVVFLGHSPMETVFGMANATEGTPISDASRGVRSLRKWLVSKARALHGTAHFLPAFVSATNTQVEGDTKKRKLKGASKTLMDGYLLPTSHEWFELSHDLLAWLSIEPLIVSGGVDANFLFSEECCRYALECARSTYFSGLPNIYGSPYHEKRLELALRVFSSLARGPVAFSVQSRLIAECTTYWNNGHRKCDAVSVTNRPCIHSYHLTKDSHSESAAEKLASRMTAELAASAPSYSPSIQATVSSSLGTPQPIVSPPNTKLTNASNLPSNPSHPAPIPDSAPTMPHSSGFKALHRCNCGKNQSTRLDPFDLKHANTDFFSNPECCRYLPSLVESHLSKLRSRDAENGPLDNDDATDYMSVLSIPPSLRQANLGWEATVMGQVRKMIRVHSENGPSTLDSPVDPQAVASERVRLADQAGFVDGYSNLLPWKVKFLGSFPISPSPSSSMRESLPATSSNGNEGLASGTLAYLGLEYECHAGHRFFASPQVLAALGLTNPDLILPIDIQHLLESSYIPIYTLCVCGKKTAQLQRLYIATPLDDSIRITFNPTIEVLGKAHHETDLYPLDAENDHGASLPRVHLESGITDHLILPPDQLVCIRLPYIYSYRNKPLLQEKLSSNAECRFFLEPHSFGLVTS
jgi:hypothetical protein